MKPLRVAVHRRRSRQMFILVDSSLHPHCGVVVSRSRIFYPSLHGGRGGSRPLQGTVLVRLALP